MKSASLGERCDLIRVEGASMGLIIFVLESPVHVKSQKITLKIKNNREKYKEEKWNKVR